MKFGSLFSGIGGLDLGLERAGMQCAWQVEIDEYCKRVLEKHWPDVTRYPDVRLIAQRPDDERSEECMFNAGYDFPEPVDLICGGFPCQPFSQAGKQAGKDDDRYLWPEMLRIVSLFKPTWFLGENVPGIDNLALQQVCSDLESQDFEVQTLGIPACSVGAPHRRERRWILGYSDINGKSIKSQHDEASRMSQNAPNADSPRLERATGALIQRQNTGSTSSGGMFGWWQSEPGVDRVVNGVPRRVDRLRALGNAVVPQVAEVIGRMILSVE